jgi:hypothetical protein
MLKEISPHTEGLDTKKELGSNEETRKVRVKGLGYADGGCGEMVLAHQQAPFRQILRHEFSQCASFNQNRWGRKSSASIVEEQLWYVKEKSCRCAFSTDTTRTIDRKRCVHSLLPLVPLLVFEMCRNPLWRRGLHRVHR